MIAFDSLILSDITLPGGDLTDERAPARTIRLSEYQPSALFENLDKTLRSSDWMSGSFTLRTRQQIGPAQEDTPWMLDADDVATFYWQPRTGQIHYQRLAGWSAQRFGFLFLHTVLPIYFTVCRTYRMLHAGCVEVEGKALLLLAPSFGGKSTLTDGFVRRGHPLLSDDKLATFEKDGIFHAVGSYPFRRPYRRAGDLGIFTPGFHPGPLRIHALYALEATDPDSPVSTEMLRGIEKMQRLTGARDVILPSEQKRNFDYLTGMANALPVVKVSVPWDVGRLREVYSAILETNELSFPNN